MPKKKVNPVHMYAEQTTGVRLSSHEKLCAERMKTLFNKIDDMNKDIKNLSYDINLLKEYANKSKGGLKVLLAVGSIIAGAVGFFKYNG